MNYLITGSSGFIGQNLIYSLKSRSNNIVGIDIKNPEYISPDKFINISINEINFENILDDINCVIHLAADGGVPKSIKYPVETFQTNVISYIKILEAIRKNKNKRDLRLIYASSGGTVIGESAELINEESRPNPKSPFGISKYCSEMISSFYRDNFHLNIIGLRFTNVYGPMMNHKPNFISLLMNSILTNSELFIFGDGEQTRDFIYISDVIDSIKASINNQYQGVLQIGSGKNISINAIIKEMDLFKKVKLPKIIYKEKRLGDVMHVKCDCQKAYKSIGFKSKVSINQGLALTLKWFMNESHID